MNAPTLAWTGLDGQWQPWLAATAGSFAALITLYLVLNLLIALWPLYRARFTQGVARQLQRAHIYVDASRLLAVNLLVAVVATAFAWVVGESLALALLVALACGLLPRVALWWLRRHRLAGMRQQLPDIAMLLAGGLRAGMSLNQSMAQSAAEVPPPFRQELELMLREQRMGASFEAALSGLERRAPLEETLLLCAALRISRQTGGNLAHTLESLADALRRKIVLEGKIRALTAQGRLQGWAMGLLPVLCAGALALIEPEGMRLLVSTGFGWATCAALLLMQLLGLYFLRRIVRIDV